VGGWEDKIGAKRGKENRRRRLEKTKMKLKVTIAEERKANEARRKLNTWARQGIRKRRDEGQKGMGRKRDIGQGKYE
jgi:hypothetical protein